MLKEIFNHVEVLDGSQAMMDQNKHEVDKRHVTMLQDYTFPSNKYDCIFGFSVLGYLTGQEVFDTLSNMESSLTFGGYLILMEPVLPEDHSEDVIPHPELGQ